MKIDSVRCILLSAPYATPDDSEWIRHLQTGYRAAAIVQVKTSDGAYGLGEAYAGSYAPEVVAAAVNQIGENILHASPEDVPGLVEKLQNAVRYWGRSGVSQGVVGALEMALWDLKGKHAGLPVYDLIGGRVHRSLPVYASGGNDKPEEHLRAEMAGYLRRGYRAVKIRGNGLTLKQLLRKVQICHEALGGNAELALDVVQSAMPHPWSGKEALRAARSLEAFDLLWLEEPMSPEQRIGLAELRRQTLIPIAGGETATTMDEVNAYIRDGSLDILQPDAAVLGGIARLVEAARLCRHAGMRVAVHAWSGAVGHMANYHAAFAGPACFMLEMSAMPNPLREIFLLEPMRLNERGEFALSAQPGLGVALPEGVEREFPFRPGTHYRFVEESAQ